MASEQLSEEAAQRIARFHDAALSRAQIVHDFYEFCELHHESFRCHHDVLDEEDDGCHLWCCQEGFGASCCYPDSRRRRCNFVDASLKSERSFIGALRPDVLRSTNSFCIWSTRRTTCDKCEIFLCILVHLDAYFFSSISSDLRVTKCWIFL